MKFDAIIFDWSGTLSDDRRPVYEANIGMRAHYGLPSNTFEEFFHTTRMTPIEFFRENGIMDSSDEIYALYRKFFAQSLEAGVRPSVYPEAHEVLSHLKNAGIPTAVVSSHPNIFLKQEAQEYLLAPFFEILHGDARDKVSALKDVCQILGVEPGRSLYVGDTTHDIQSAREAGLTTAGVATGYHTQEALESQSPDHLFLNLLDLLPII
ncbi:HAD family hydrolase [Candidatus Uhrbacteria bacterium]|nr:HAD family hydrolase [Candidatus Uhrbacteria bacterium]